MTVGTEVRSVVCRKAEACQLRVPLLFKSDGREGHIAFRCYAAALDAAMVRHKRTYRHDYRHWCVSQGLVSIHIISIHIIWIHVADSSNYYRLVVAVADGDLP